MKKKLIGIQIILVVFGLLCTFVEPFKITALKEVCAASILFNSGCLAALFFFVSEVTYDNEMLRFTLLDKAISVPVNDLEYVKEFSYWYIFACKKGRKSKKYVVIKLDNKNYNFIYDKYNKYKIGRINRPFY